MHTFLEVAVHLSEMLYGHQKWLWRGCREKEGGELMQYTYTYHTHTPHTYTHTHTHTHTCMHTHTQPQPGTLLFAHGLKNLPKHLQTHLTASTVPRMRDQQPFPLPPPPAADVGRPAPPPPVQILAREKGPQLSYISEHDLQLGTELGQGEFGSVLKGVYKGTDGKKVRRAIRWRH